MPLAEITRDLQSQISQSCYVETDDLGQHYIATPFVFGDGDQPVVALAPNGGSWMLSDQGTTLFRLGFQLNDAEHSAPENQRRLDSALAMAGISRNDGELTKPLSPGQYADAVFDFVHALLKIDELGDFPAVAPQPAIRHPGAASAPRAASQSVSRPPFADEVAQLVSEVVPSDRFQVRWNDTKWDHQKEYTVDCYVNGMPTPLFLYALANDGNARDATITIYRFQSQAVTGRHIGIYRNTNRVRKDVRSKLNAVCETTFGNLERERQGIKEFLQKTAAV